MPIEIKELHITAVVSEGDEKIPSAKDRQKMKEEIIAECLEQVMKILEDKEER
ncbi:MAG: hypothetical protein KDD01_02500 [Phaeodactylibacter sp.]|nr:hypothetical protein [Phaeodactylibacter sp.]